MRLRSFLAKGGRSCVDLAALAGVHLSTVYRWLEEEDEHGYVRNISGECIARLVEGSGGKLTAHGILGIGKGAA